MVAAPFERSAQLGYLAGFTATLLLAVVGQVLLRLLPEGRNPVEAIQDIGYSFTGISLLGGFLLARWARRAPERILARDPETQRRIVWREYLGVAFLCMLSALFGVIYWGLGGRPVERHARTFIALGPAAYLALAPRPSRWRDSNRA